MKSHWTAAINALLLTAAVSQIRTQVDLVVVPVTVRDSAGKLVTGLTRSDFAIYEDGKPQKISNFDIDPQPLSAAIVIDDGMSATKLRWLYPPVSPPLFIALTAGFGPNDEMSAFRYDREVYQLADFTNDPAVIEKSFEVIAGFIENRPNDTTDVLGERGPDWLRSMINILGSGGGNGGGGGQTTIGTAPPPPRSTRADPRPSDRVMHDAVYEAATALQRRLGNRRKMIIVITDGAVSGTNLHNITENTDLLLKNEIQFYGVAADFATFGSFGLLTKYAQASGGDVFPGTSTKSLEAAFAQVTEQARYQYVLSYTSNNTAGSLPVFRTIEIKTRSTRLKVAHRRGYTQYPKAENFRTEEK